MKALKKHKVCIISITSLENQTLEQLSNYTLRCVADESTITFVNLVFIMSLKYVLDLIYASLFSKNYKDAIHHENTFFKMFKKNDKDFRKEDGLMIKLVVSDMDGTLLDHQNKVTKENREAIKKLQKQGIKFAVITGRDPFTMIEFEKEIGISFDALCGNGACILYQDGSIEYRHILTCDQVNQIIDIFDKYDLMPTFYSAQGPLCLLTPEEYFIHLRDVMVPALRLLVSDVKFTDEELMKMVDQTTFIKKQDLEKYQIFKVMTKSIDLERLFHAKDHQISLEEYVLNSLCNKN